MLYRIVRSALFQRLIIPEVFAFCHIILILGLQSGCRKILILICHCLIFRLNLISTLSAPEEIKAPHLKTTILIKYLDGDLNISTVSTSLLRVNSSLSYKIHYNSIHVNNRTALLYPMMQYILFSTRSISNF